MRHKVRLTKEAARQDETYRRIIDAFVDLSQHNVAVKKAEILKEASAQAWETMVRWKYVIEFVTTEYPGVVILALTGRFFTSPRNKAAHSVDPGKYLSPNYASAEGFASLQQFVASSERNRNIALAKYSQQQIAAARALESAERYNAAIGPQPALFGPPS